MDAAVMVDSSTRTPGATDESGVTWGEETLSVDIEPMDVCGSNQNNARRVADAGESNIALSQWALSL